MFPRHDECTVQTLIYWREPANQHRPGKYHSRKSRLTFNIYPSTSTRTYRSRPSSFSNRPIPHLQPFNLLHNQHPYSKMERRPSVTHKAASTNKVPTPHTAAPVARSASYSSLQEDFHGSNSAETAKRDEGDYSRQLQTASTELLNDERVGLGSKAGRTLQRVLMDTEHRLKEQRRESLHKPGHKLAVPRGIILEFMSADFSEGR